MKIRTKIILNFIAICVLFIVGSILALYSTSAIKDKSLAMNTCVIILLAAVIIAGILIITLAQSIGKPLNKLKGALDKLAAGSMDINLDLKQKGEFDNINNSFNKLEAEITALFKDAEMFSAAASNGMLETRVDATKYKGVYRKIFENINQAFDIIVLAINESENILKKMSMYDLTEQMTGDYKGSLKEFTGSIGIMRERLLRLEEILSGVAKGDMGLLEVIQKTGRLSENDRMFPSIVSMMESIRALETDADMLSVAAVEGKLSTRVDVSKHKGDYRKVVEGVNHILDVVTEPVNEVLDVMRAMSVGNNNVSVKGDYQGELKELKETVNLTVNTITNAVNETENALNEISEGHLNIDKMRDFRGNWNLISVSVNKTIDFLNDIMNNINLAAEQVATGSGQVSESSQALSQGATEQASSIEELSSSITEIATQTKQNAANAGKANGLSMQAKTDADTGNSQMKLMLKSMTDINEASTNISKVIKVIDDIAFQTNILALNAAVEAARAGQYGKGFAVVAEEVRSLAAKSANAAKETEEMIEGSIQKAEAGTKIASETADALVKIVESIDKVSELVADISSASNEQATGISQINMGIDQVSQVIQTNSATAEEGAASSEELSSQADLLKQMVGRFVLRNNVNNVSSPLALSSQQHVFNKKAAKPLSSQKTVLSSSNFGKY